MAFDEGLAQRIRENLEGQPAISERRMFGGLAFMARGYMAVGVSGESLMARVGPAAYADALRQPGARPMDFTGKPMKGYVFVDPEGLADDAVLARWVAMCLAFVATLPPR